MVEIFFSDSCGELDAETRDKIVQQIHSNPRTKGMALAQVFRKGEQRQRFLVSLHANRRVPCTGDLLPVHV